MPPLDGHDDDPEPPGQGRVKARASMRPISPGHVLARLSDPLSHAVQELIDNLGSHYNIAEGSQTPGVPCSSSRVGMKRRAESITRSQYEVYSFSTKYDLPEAAVDELLRMLSNVCIHAHVLSLVSICLSICLQERFSPGDIQHKTMKAMDKAALQAMIPDHEMFAVDLKEGTYTSNLD